MRTALLILLLLAAAAGAQPAETFVLGDARTPWTSGGRGEKPEIVRNAFLGQVELTNDPGSTIEFADRPGWIGPLRFDEQENIAARVLDSGSIRAPNAGRGLEKQLEGTVNGDHLVAFERKPTLFEPRVVTRGIWLILDFGTPVGVHRMRFYPRNTIAKTPAAPFHSDFLRGYEVWVNEFPESPNRPDALVARDAKNEEPVVEVQVPSQYVRFLKIKSLADVPFEIDEVEVYGTGFLQQGLYLSDIIGLGDRATVGFVEWEEEAVGNPDFSRLVVRARTGNDATPLRYVKVIPQGGYASSLEREEVTREEYPELEPIERGGIEDDTDSWSPWFPVRSGELLGAPSPRPYIQFQLEFRGDLFAARQVDELRFDYLQPPIADTLWAEVFPRLAEVEKPASFRYAVRLKATGQIRGFDRLEVDSGVRVERVREAKLDGEPLDVEVDFIRDAVFSISFPPIRQDGALLEFTFDLPIFRFGSTFSGRAYNSRSGAVPQAVQPGNAVQFEPEDVDELSGLSVAIPKPQIGRLVGEISMASPVFTPNGDGVNDAWEVFFNILQVTRPAPVRLELYDLAGRRVGRVFDQERGIGPVNLQWDGRLADGSMVLPGTYVWVLKVEADAFVERHSGVVAVVY